MRRLYLFLPILLLLGCSEGFDSTSPDTTPVVIEVMVLEQDVSWTYQELRPDFSRPRLDGYPVDTSQFTRAVVGDTVINDETWYMVQTTEHSDGEAKVFTGYFANLEGGLWSGYFDDGTFKKNLYIKYPAAVGDSYKLTYGDAEAFTTTATVTGVDVPVEFDGDTVACCEVVFVNDFMDQVQNIDWFAPGIGLVKRWGWSLSIGLPGGGYRPPDYTQRLLSVDLPE